MTEPRQCPECGAPLGPDAPDGACPVCALRSALGPPAGRAEAVVTEKPGDHIGHYKLLERIGEGGYGLVYLAEQAEPIRRRVALKIVKLGMDTKQVIARFEAERQALALMDHPNIAHVLDAGATDTGRPYFVMELVRGVRITEYCDRHQLSTRARLDLFMQVCHAVQHAHQKGIIHRDLKPSNILVTEQAGKPVPKVIDFGIAKATAQPLTDKTLYTAFQQFLGTPAYMSPEQAGLSHADLDTRSDIYSLGVLLYELVTGHTPFESKKLLHASFEEMRRLIREEEPTRPSTRLSGLPKKDLTAVAQHRRTEPPRLIHLVRGDLDWIVMKCLEKDRARRYGTATELARDIERHLNHEPVTAAAPRALYQLGKFVRRHRQGVTVGAILLVLLAGALVWQTVRVRRVERQAAMVATFFENLLKDVRRSVAVGRDTALLREVLDQASARADTELKSEPVVQAVAELGMGFVFADLRDDARAEAVFRKARETFRRAYGQKNPGVAAATFGLALVSLRQGHYAEAEASARLALATGHTVFGRSHTVVGHSLNCLAAALEAQDKLEEAEARCREALAIGRTLPGEEGWMLSNSLSTLGKVLCKQARWAEAELALREALDRRGRLLGRAHPELGELFKRLALTLERQGKTEEAALVLRQAGQALEEKSRATPR